MQRRKFLNSSIVLGLLGYASACKSLGVNAPLNSNKPPVLKKGDTVGLICPASGIKPEQLQLAKMQIKSFGLNPYLGQHVSSKSGYLAGSDQERVDDIHTMYSNSNVKAIWAIRGGYGTARILPLLDVELIKNNPKPLIGYSDLTAPLNYLFQQSGVINYHFTMPGSLMSEFSEKQLFKYLLNNHGSRYELDETIVNKNDLIVRAKLLGGNLTVLTSLLGTPYEINLDDSILFLEDVGEKPYRIDRMLNQLMQSGGLRKIKGLILGQFTDCDGDMRDEFQTIEELIISFFDDQKIPMVTNAPFGHVDDQWVLPVGADVTLNLKDQYLIIHNS